MPSALLARTELLHEGVCAALGKQQQASQPSCREAATPGGWSSSNSARAKKRCERPDHRLRQGQADGESARQAGSGSKRLRAPRHRPPKPQRAGQRAQRLAAGCWEKRIASALARRRRRCWRSAPVGPNSRCGCGVPAPDCGAQAPIEEPQWPRRPAPVESAAPKVQIQMPAQPSPLRAEVRTEPQHR